MANEIDMSVVNYHDVWDQTQFSAWDKTMNNAMKLTTCQAPGNDVLGFFFCSRLLSFFDDKYMSADGHC